MAGEAGARIQMGPDRPRCRRRQEACRQREKGRLGSAHDFSPGKRASQYPWQAGQKALGRSRTGRELGRWLRAHSQCSQWSIPNAWPSSWRMTPARLVSVRFRVETKATPLPKTERPRIGAPSGSEKGRGVSPSRGRWGKESPSQASKFDAAVEPQRQGSTLSVSEVRGWVVGGRRKGGSGRTEAPSRTRPRVELETMRLDGFPPKVPPP